MVYIEGIMRYICKWYNNNNNNMEKRWGLKGQPFKGLFHLHACVRVALELSLHISIWFTWCVYVLRCRVHSLRGSITKFSDLGLMCSSNASQLRSAAWVAPVYICIYTVNTRYSSSYECSIHHKWRMVLLAFTLNITSCKKYGIYLIFTVYIWYLRYIYT